MRKLGAFLLAAGTLMLETAWMRVFTLAQGYHLSFMAISVAMLGLGAGGTLVAIVDRPRPGRSTFRGKVQDRKSSQERMLVPACAAFCVVTLGSYWLANYLPLDVYLIAWKPEQLLYLAIFYLVLALPFLCSGAATSVLLGESAAPNVIYAANLLGSAAGIAAALGALSAVDGPGAIALSAAAGGLAAAALAWDGERERFRPFGVALLCAGCLAIAGGAYACPSWRQVQLSPYRPLSYVLQFPDAQLLSRRWNALSRVDVVASGAIHVAPGLSLTYTGDMPVQRGLYVDANPQAAIMGAQDGGVRSWAAHLPQALAFRLRPQASALILEPGGGLEVAVARSLGASRTTAVSSNPLVADAVRQFGGDLYADAVVGVVVQSPRSFVRTARNDPLRRFTLVDLALNEGQQTVVSGAYALSEDYRYTVQALADYLAVLEPGGILAVHRWLQTPPSESLRAAALVVEAVERESPFPPQDSVVAVRSWATMLILAKNGAFTTAELDEIRRFCAQRQFDLVYLPGLQAQEVNRFHVYPGAPYWAGFARLLDAADREAFYRQQDYDVRPPTDDWPFFFHFFRVEQVPDVLRQFGRTWQPFGGGGFLILVALAAIAILAAVTLIVMPVWLGGKTSRRVRFPGRGVSLAYFGCLGFAYLAVEIPLIQRFVLFLDHPIIAFAAVVGTLLVSSGVGSLWAQRLNVRWAIPVIVCCLLLFSILLSRAFDLLLGAPLIARLASTALLLAPVGLLMGMPFPSGVAVLRAYSPGSVPWAWAVNGCASVVASMLSALVALAWGFNAVLFLACVFYAAAWLLWLRWRASLRLLA